MGFIQENTHCAAHYDKQDIKEQYCISNKGLGALEKDKHIWFGCLSSHRTSCSSRSSFFTACVRQKVPSDENLYELYQRHPSEYAPYPRLNRNPWGPLPPEICSFDEELRSSYFRRKNQTDPSGYTWMPTDEESIKMEKPKSVTEYSSFHKQQSALCQSMISSKKHVSFARSHTLASFDDAVSSLTTLTSNHEKIRRKERLLDVRKSEIIPITRQPESENVIILDKGKRTPTKTQATQTEIKSGRKFVQSSCTTSSPNMLYKVRMVSQEAQTNGFIFNGRKLVKSFSEAGSNFGISYRIKDPHPYGALLHHEPVHRTYSDEPPRPPFAVTPPVIPIEPSQRLSESDISSLSKSEPETDDSGQSKTEIFINFKPQITEKFKKLTKTLSDGDIVLYKKKNRNVEDRPLKSLSVSQENVQDDQIHFTPYFQKVPIKNEGIYKILDETHAVIYVQDSIDEEFHENLIYKEIYLSQINDQITKVDKKLADKYSAASFVHRLLDKKNDEKNSPSASNDSLTNGTRDQSDGIWNESESTVLQIDSGTDSATVLSTSEFNTTMPCSTDLLNPSRRNHLLLLHQQRSSIDTELLDEEIVNANYPIITAEKPEIKNEPFRSPRRNFSVPKSYSWQKVSDTAIESHTPAIVPDILLARTDSCKTNTDISESTTTDDYLTANSGTDSSRKSGSLKGSDNFNISINQRNNGSLRKADADMVVPFDDGSLIHPNSESWHTPSVSKTCTGRSTPSEYSSSSSGSYSVGSLPDMLEKTKASAKRRENIIDPDDNVCENLRSRKYSSADNHAVYKCSRYEFSQNDFLLNLSINQYSKTCVTSRHDDKCHILEKNGSTGEIKSSLYKEKKSKCKLQNQRKGTIIKKNVCNGSFARNELEERATSDESSYDLKGIMETSPKKNKKTKETFRRKSLPRSPVRQQYFDVKPSSLPSSLSRRKPLKQCSKNKNRENSRTSSTNLPLNAKKHAKTHVSSSKLKALSVESLRSVSPGSDSVFYSDPSNHTTENQINCLHCGKEVDVITHVDSYKNCVNHQNRHSIVQPPVEFGDSPREKITGRFYKKVDNRTRSEERFETEGKYRCKADSRAKSEERGGKTLKDKLRPMAKSTSSQEQLKATEPCPSILHGAPDHEEDNGIYDIPYHDGFWIHINERDELISRNLKMPNENEDQNESISSTESETGFRKRYQGIAHRMIHRKSCIEMYKRQNSQSFDSSPYLTLRKKIEETLKIMLVLWCQENKALSITTSVRNECDKTVTVCRQAGEFGFRIHGSKPVVVSAIEPGTPAETSGLEVGDIVLSVNGVSVLDKTHSEVVKIAHDGSDTLNLEVVRTCYAFNAQSDNSLRTLYSGYLWKLKGYTPIKYKWIRRWFCLRENNCLYYYKTDNDKQPVGIVTLLGHELKALEEVKGEESWKPNQFIIQRQDEIPLFLAADTIESQKTWMHVIEKSIHESQMTDNFLNETKRNLTLPPNIICQPDCFGYLVKLGTQRKPWNRRYCVLKNACLFFYIDITAKSAFGVAYLHGYRIQQSLSGSKNHAFEIIPPDPSKKWFSFCAESEADKKRWIAALEYSIDRWLKISVNCSGR